MNKEKAETLLENYQALSELYSNIRKELDRTRKVLMDTIKLAEEMLESIEDEGMCSEYYEDELNKIKSITKGGDNE